MRTPLNSDDYMGLIVNDFVPEPEVEEADHSMDPFEILARREEEQGYPLAFASTN